MAAAERLVGGSRGRLKRQIFLSTEDPGAVAYFGGLAPRWTAAWTDGPRKPDRTKSTLAYVAEVLALAPAASVSVSSAAQWRRCQAAF